MDPNEALKRFRDYMTRLGEDAEAGEVDDDDVAFAVELWEGLDGWISNGGFLPKDWER